MINAYKCITSVILCLPCVCIGICLSNQSKRSFVSFHLFKVADSGHDGVALSWLQPLQLHDRNKSLEVAEDILRFLRHCKDVQRKCSGGSPLPGALRLLHPRTSSDRQRGAQTCPCCGSFFSLHSLPFVDFVFPISLYYIIKINQTWHTYNMILRMYIHILIYIYI
jgi:hypothetical protein